MGLQGEFPQRPFLSGGVCRKRFPLPLLVSLEQTLFVSPEPKWRQNYSKINYGIKIRGKASLKHGVTEVWVPNTTRHSESSLYTHNVTRANIQQCYLTIIKCCKWSNQPSRVKNCTHEIIYANRLGISTSVLRRVVACVRSLRCCCCGHLDSQVGVFVLPEREHAMLGWPHRDMDRF